MKRILTVLIMLLAAVSVVSAQTAKTVIVPCPMEVTAVKGAYTLTAKSVIAATDAELVRSAELFASYVANELGATLDVEQKQKGGIVSLYYLLSNFSTLRCLPDLYFADGSNIL